LTWSRAGRRAGIVNPYGAISDVPSTAAVALVSHNVQADAALSPFGGAEARALAKRRGLEREIAIGDRNVRLCRTLSFWAAA